MDLIAVNDVIAARALRESGEAEQQASGGVLSL
jgi:hypothetical protein